MINLEGSRNLRRYNSARLLAPICLALALGVAGCSGFKDDSKFPVSKYGPASPKIVGEGEEVPKGGGVYKVGKPYRVAGRWYRPEEDKDYDKRGLASWYGPTFHGRQTANGEVFDRYALTGAHPTLPMPSYVRVTNESNNHSVIVRINDRGPFSEKRVIDVSEKAAELLDFKRDGLAKVRVQYVGPASLDGNDSEMLLASFSPNGNAQFPTTMLADASSASPLPTSQLGQQTAQPVTLAAVDMSHNQNTIAARSVAPVPLVAAPAPAMAPHRQIATVAFATPSYQPAIQPPVMVASNAQTYPLPQPATTGQTVVQLGVFGEQQNAQTLASRMGHLGTVAVEPVEADGQPLYRVRIMVENDDLDATLAHATMSGIRQPRIISH